MALFTHHIPGGSFTCAMPADRVYLLAFEYPPNNFLSPEFIGAFSLCLTMIRDRYPSGVVITTSRIPNFYCSGHTQDEPMVWALFKQVLT
jgi:enoyl-CoA hydratase/carnithine racemase